MHKIPAPNHPAREMFDMADLAAIGTGERLPVVGLPAARAMARRFFDGADRAVMRAVYIVLRPDDMLELISIGRRGGWKREWQFGLWAPLRKYKDQW